MFYYINFIIETMFIKELVTKQIVAKKNAQLMKTFEIMIEQSELVGFFM